MPRRRRAPREGIAEGEFRNVTFRLGSVAYNALVEAARDRSISDVGEQVILAALSPSAAPPATAEDVRLMIREEIRAALSEQHVQGVHASNYLMRDTMEAMRLGVDEFKRREALRNGPSNWIV